MAITDIVMAMLSIIPEIRIVASVAEAIPKKPLFTELITALVLGELKKAKPKPINPRSVIMVFKLAPSVKKERVMSPKVVKAIPKEATIRGSTLSDNHPARGEKEA